MHRILFIMFCGSVLISCAPSYFMNKESVPKDFKSNGYVLLVQKQEIGAFKDVQNKGVEKLMRKNCKCMFEMVSPEDLKTNQKYQDLSKYPYLLRNRDEAMIIHDYPSQRDPSTGIIKSNYAEYRDHVFVDRRTNSMFPPTGIPATSYSLGIKMLSKKLGKM